MFHFELFEMLAKDGERKQVEQMYQASYYNLFWLGKTRFLWNLMVLKIWSRDQINNSKWHSHGVLTTCILDFLQSYRQFNIVRNVRVQNVYEFVCFICILVQNVYEFVCFICILVQNVYEWEQRKFCFKIIRWIRLRIQIKHTHSYTFCTSIQIKHTNSYTFCTSIQIKHTNSYTFCTSSQCVFSLYASRLGRLVSDLLIKNITLDMTLY
jgi:hypothetical protein